MDFGVVIRTYVACVTFLGRLVDWVTASVETVLRLGENLFHL